MFKSVKNKFIVLSILFIVSTVTIPVVFLVLQFRQNFNERSILMLESTLDMIHTGLVNSMSLGNHDNVQNVIQTISENNSVGHIRIFTKDGQILYSSEYEEIGKNIGVISPHHVKLETTFLGQRIIEREPDDGIFRITEPIVNTPDCRSCHGEKKHLAYLDVDTDFTQAEVNFYTGSVHFLFLAVAIIIIMILGSYFLYNHYINRPLALFFNAIAEVDRGNLNVRLPAEKEDEFGILQGHFNQMVSRIQSSKEQIEELHFEQLQNADKLVTLGELTSEMAHEINNYTAIVLSRTDFLKLESSENESLTKYQEDLDVIINHISKVSNLTSNILRHGKQRKENFRDIELNKLVDEGLRILEPIMEKRNITYTKNHEIEKAIIKGDPFQIEQLITNLAINALDAIGNNGQLTISISSNNDNQIILSITDTGMGISSSEMDQIFSPFYTTKSQDKGTGLGLYIVKNICKNHGAEIICKSKAGEGTSFIITFNGEVK